MTSMRQDAERQVKMAKGHYKGDHDKKIRNAPQLLCTGEYVYINCPPMITSAAKRLAINSYSRVMSPNGGQFRTVEISPSIVTMNGDGISTTVWTDQVTLGPPLIKIPDVKDDANSGHKDSLLIDAMQMHAPPNSRNKHALWQHTDADTSKIWRN